MKKVLAPLFWTLLALAGAGAYATLAFRRNEPVNSGCILIAALCTYAIGYRFYSKWLAVRVLASTTAAPRRAKSTTTNGFSEFGSDVSHKCTMSVEAITSFSHACGFFQLRQSRAIPRRGHGSAHLRSA